MKKLQNGILIWLILVSVSAVSQSKFSFNLQSGLTVPLLDYGADNLEKGCFTMPGIVVSPGFGYQLNHQFEIELQSGIYFHPVDVSSLGASKVANDPFLEDLFIRSESYRLIRVAGGGNYSVYDGRYFEVAFSALAGILWSKTPYQLYKPKYFLTGPPYYEITSARDMSFVYAVGLQTAWRLNNCLILTLGADFMQANASYRFSTGSGIRTDNRMISTLNISAGIKLAVF
ncbi:MAG: hypothetical protein Q8S18_11035 [Bacteroidales bacterium]|nr:hypothetical protein [Bacteroidales bacterium]